MSGSSDRRCDEALNNRAARHGEGKKTRKTDFMSGNRKEPRCCRNSYRKMSSSVNDKRRLLPASADMNMHPESPAPRPQPPASRDSPHVEFWQAQGLARRAGRV